ncbi:MAG: hypothetical protein LBH43_12425 [Treponema sp.]|nr:hypothetical protein [Treponema sp.]
MKRLLFLFFTAGFFSLISCGQGPVRSCYYPELPVLAPYWEEILGVPHWRLEWVDAQGNWRSWEGKQEPDAVNLPGLSLNEEWAVPVLAWPFWPEKGLIPGLMRPAGALFPWDVSGKRIVLGYKQGIDAFFWRELAASNNNQSTAGTPRTPWYFDWPRFRELMDSSDIPEEVRLDPWTADWKAIAQKTVESGFDRRRIKAETGTKVTIPCPGSLWIGTSPFSAPLTAPFVFYTGENPQTWFSAQGQLRLQKEAWIYIPWH